MRISSGICGHFRKHSDIFGHMRLAKAQFSLQLRMLIRVFTVYYRTIFCTCAGWYKSAPFAHIRRHFFTWHGSNDLIYTCTDLKCSDHRITSDANRWSGFVWQLSNDMDLPQKDMKWPSIRSSYCNKFNRLCSKWNWYTFRVGNRLCFITKARLFKYMYIENFITKNWKFSDKNKPRFFHISAQKIDRGCSEAVLTNTHNLCFWAEIRKMTYTPVNPSFTI